MGFFSRKKKHGAASTPSSPASSIASAFPSPVLGAAAAVGGEPLQAVPCLTLRVLVESTHGAPSEPALFHVTVETGAPVSAIRRAVAAQLGAASSSLSVFKVAIPCQAPLQASAYSARYGAHVDLVTAFPSFNLDDPAQLAASLTTSRAPEWPGATGAPAPRVADWYPDPVAADVISVLARVCPAAVSSSSSSLTLVAHVAAPTYERQGSRPSSSHTQCSAQRAARRAPVVVDIAADASVDDLKRALLRADGRGTGDDAAATRLDRVVVWRVEMSEDEMVVIEERGGLRKGKMPWPYPPTAAVPVQLDDGRAPLAAYFAAPYASNARIVSLSVWIHPNAAAGEFARRLDASAAADSEHDVPPFQYPMPVSPDFPGPARASPLPIVDLASPTIPSAPAAAKERKRGVRSRPSTAPAAAAAPAFGGTGSPSAAGASLLAAPAPPMHGRANSMRLSNRPRTASPLSGTPLSAVQGLGIAMAHPRASVASTTSSSGSAGSAESSASTSPDNSDEDVPGLCFSQLSLACATAAAAEVPRTPEHERPPFHWRTSADAVPTKKSPWPTLHVRSALFA